MLKYCWGTVLEVFLVFLKLGMTSFGGPAAHIGYFRDEFVNRRGWLKDKGYADLVALCQFLPGPASSQVGMGIGLSRAGIPGAVAAWCGFTLPSAAFLIIFAQAVTIGGKYSDAGWLHGLKILAVAVVAHAVISMARSFCNDRVSGTITIFSAAMALCVSASWGQIAVIVIGACAGRLFLTSSSNEEYSGLNIPVGRITAYSCLTLFFSLLVLLPLMAAYWPNHLLAVVDRFYRVGALVFGGGHVVLPLLQSAVSKGNWVDNELFMAGYGAAQAVPGPLFTFSAYLGAIMSPVPHGWIGGLASLLAIFLPSFLLVIGLLPLWEKLRRNNAAKTSIAGVNAAVVGLLGAALYNPLWTNTIRTHNDFVLALAAFGLLAIWKLPPWKVVLVTATAGLLIEALH